MTHDGVHGPLGPGEVPLPPAEHAASVFSGKGLFTTSDERSAFGKGADWQAYQMDPEGTPNAAWDPASRACYWMARPTQAMADRAARLGIPFIAQAESEAELARALALFVTPPKALVGKVARTSPLRDQAIARGWDLILEWYANAHPWEEAPDAEDYPRFVNVCFGIYSEGEPGGEGYVPQSKSLADYRAVWGGSYSVWKAEAMTEADWAAFT